MNSPVYTQDDIQALVVFAGEVLLAVGVGICLVDYWLSRRTDNGPRGAQADAVEAFQADATATFQNVLHGSPTLAEVRAERLAALEAENLDADWAKLDQAVNGGEAS